MILDVDFEQVVNQKPYGIVYAIRCMVNGKFYIGQHLGSDVEKRIKSHLADAKRNGSCKKICRAIEKHGENNFIHGIVDYASSQDELNVLECYYISIFDSITHGYNIRYGGAGGRLTESHKKKIGDANRGVRNGMFGVKNHLHPNFGRKISDETRLKMRMAKLGKPSVRGSYKLSQEAIEKIRLFNLGRKQTQDTIELRASKLRGRKYPGKGKGRKLTEEHKEKIRIANLRRFI